MAEGDFSVEIITSEKTKFQGEVAYIRLAGYEGEMGILKNHAPLIALLQPGECHLRTGDIDRYLALSDGFVKVQENRILVIVSFALEPEEIDVEEQEKIVREEESFFKGMASEGPQFAIHRLRLLRARACLRVATQRA
jgi:F-type H+-transporting ATPase subunit epsilon